MSGLSSLPRCALPLALGVVVALPACGPGAGTTNGNAVLEDVPRFDADSAFDLLERQVAFGPRVPGTAAHRQQLDWMVDYLRARADTVLVQEFWHDAASGDSVPMANVFARFRPGAESRILLLAHWDTRPMAEHDPDESRRDEPIPGANDGASGVAVLMQLAQVLSSHSPPLGVDLLFTDGEDYGPGEMYLGAEYFAAHQPPGYPPLYGVLIDMVGDRDPRFPVEWNSAQFAPEVVERVWSIAEQTGYGQYFPRVQGGAVTDDHIPLNQAGIRTIDIIDLDYGPGGRFWHTHEDNLDNVGPEGLKAVGQVLTTLIYSGG